MGKKRITEKTRSHRDEKHDKNKLNMKKGEEILHCIAKKQTIKLTNTKSAQRRCVYKRWNTQLKLRCESFSIDTDCFSKKIITLSKKMIGLRVKNHPIKLALKRYEEKDCIAIIIFSIEMYINSIPMLSRMSAGWLFTLAHLSTHPWHMSESVWHANTY